VWGHEKLEEISKKGIPPSHIKRHARENPPRNFGEKLSKNTSASQNSNVPGGAKPHTSQDARSYGDPVNIRGAAEK